MRLQKYRYSAVFDVGRVISHVWTMPIIIGLLLLGGSLWAKRADFFSRIWSDIKIADGKKLKLVTVLPKSIRNSPVVIYAHGYGGNLMDDGMCLRQIAELGFPAVSFEYDQTGQRTFESDFEALLLYLRKQDLAGTNGAIWIGFSLGANRMVDFALKHSELQPKLLVLINAQGLTAGEGGEQFAALHCPILLVHGELDTVFPPAEITRFAAALFKSGVDVELRVLRNVDHSMKQERAVVFRGIAEYCLTRLEGVEAWRRYSSINQWMAASPPLWRFCMPAIVLGFIWSVFVLKGLILVRKSKLKRFEWPSRWWGILALLSCCLYIGLHRFSATNSLAIAGKEFGERRKMEGLEKRFNQLIWDKCKSKLLGEHIEIAQYNRKIVNWRVDDETYKNYVASPIITGILREQIEWRRTLWEEFYPRIRHQSSLDEVAKIVVRHLRERVTIADLSNLSQEVPEVWLRQLTDRKGFEVIYVAALRSVGVPARLDVNQRAEFWDGARWLNTPRPVIVTL